MFPTNHIDIDVPNCPPTPPILFHGIPSWVVAWSMGLGFVLLIASGFLIAYLIEARSDVKVARAKAAGELAKNWTACPTCGANFHPKLADAEKFSP